VFYLEEVRHHKFSLDPHFDASMFCLSSLRQPDKGPTAPSRPHSRRSRRYKLCRQPPSAQDRRAMWASAQVMWPSAQQQPSAQTRWRRLGHAVGTNGRRHRGTWALLRLTDGDSCADGPQITSKKIPQAVPSA
jgi:hypothetical protein